MRHSLSQVMKKLLFVADVAVGAAEMHTWRPL
jgi:hypothetical protein